MLRSFLFLALIVFGFSAQAQPPRKAWMGAYGSFSARGFAIDTVAPGSTLHELGLRKGDTLYRLNNQELSDVGGYSKLTSALRTGDLIQLTFRRGNKDLSRKGKATMLPYATMDGAYVIYDWVQYGQCSLRTIVRKPKSTAGKLPAVLLVPGYNCGSIEGYTQGSYSHLIKSWVDNGFVVVTIEKTGLGDSYNCEPCSEATLVTDIRTFDAGYRYMEQLPYVDVENLFIWGHSMGGIIAPEIARMHNPRGVIVFATVFRPWSEFLLEMHRVQFPLDGKSYTQTEDEVRLLQKIYYEFFRLGKSPAELYQNPEYRDVVASELEFKDAANTDMWGRHWHFWQQIDSLDMAASWSQVKCPVLSIFGGADYIACSELEHQLITRTVNAAHPGNATHITIPDIDHILIRHPDWKSAHAHFSDRAYRDKNFHHGFAEEVNKWMKQQLKR